MVVKVAGLVVISTEVAVAVQEVTQAMAEMALRRAVNPAQHLGLGVGVAVAEHMQPVMAGVRVAAEVQVY
jgi:hypothetical protein